MADKKTQIGPAVLTFLGIGAFARVLLAARTEVINTDGPAFLSMAAGLLGGDWHAATRAEFHPLYPALIALGGGTEAAAIAISIAAGVLAGIPIYFMVRELADPRVGAITLGLYELHPEMIETQSAVYQDGLFLLVAMLAAWASFRYLKTGRGFVAAAAASAVGWCTKSEGMIVAVLTAATCLWGLKTHKTWKQAAIGAFVALVIVGGFVAYVSSFAGRLTLSPKSSASVVIGMKAGHDVGEYGKWHDRRREHGALVTSTWYFGQYAWKTFRGGYLLAVIAALVLCRFWTVKHRWCLLAWTAFFAFCVWFANFKSGHAISTRYLGPVVALTLALPAAAFVQMMDPHPTSMRVAAAAASLLFVFAGFRQPVLGRGGENIGFRQAGEWVLERSGAGAVVLSTSDKTWYYARAGSRGPSFPVPPDAQYVVVGEEDVVDRGWTDATFAPLVKLRTFPETPERKVKTVFVYGRAP